MISWLCPEASMARTANSSPPNRATTSDSRNVFSKTPPARIRVRSPSAWPNVSLICFRPSTSMKTRRIPRPDRRLSFSCRSARARKPRRFCLQHVLLHGATHRAPQKLAAWLALLSADRPVARLRTDVSEQGGEFPICFCTQTLEGLVASCVFSR